MLKFKKLLLSTAVLTSAVCFSANFAQAAEINSGTVTASHLNLRSNPSLSGSIEEILDQGDKVKILGQSDNWFKVQAPDGKIAWAFKEYVKVTASSISRGDSVPAKGAVKTAADIDIVSYAKKFLGVRYVWGGTSPSGFDCSGFIQHIYDHFGYDLHRVAADQAKDGTKVDKSNLQPGDLVFFDTDRTQKYINHVGMYIGNGKFIHASSGHGSVTISDITTGFYAQNYMTARRVLK